jgi:hypothetical protein
MKSHLYEFAWRDLIRICLAPLIPVALFTLAMHLGAASGLLPDPRPAMDTDRTILFHQAEASRQLHDADLLLLGDSSCLMDLSAVLLGQLLPYSALNLGTLSYLDLPAFATILEHYAAANPNQLRIVLIMMHPEGLRRSSASQYHATALARFYNRTDSCGPNASPLLCALGVEIFQGRVWSRLAPQPLEGGYGRFYGFNHDLWKHLSANLGSAFDPGQFDPAMARGSAEFQLARSLESSSQTFRASVPPGVKLVAGITPVPESLASPGYEENYQEMLRTWSEWLHADAALTDLPPVLPDHLFASQTHLNARGVQLYTEELALHLEKFPFVP